MIENLKFNGVTVHIYELIFLELSKKSNIFNSFTVIEEKYVSWL
jgi:hypothetical protein